MTLYSPETETYDPDLYHDAYANYVMDHAGDVTISDGHQLLDLMEKRFLFKEFCEEMRLELE